MSFSYAPDDWPAEGPPPVEHVRLLIGDTRAAKRDLEDEEIAAILASEGSVLASALVAAEAVLAKLSRDADTNGAGISATRSQRFSQLKDTIAQLEAQRARGGAAVLVELETPTYTYEGED